MYLSQNHPIHVRDGGEYGFRPCFVVGIPSATAVFAVWCESSTLDDDDGDEGEEMVGEGGMLDEGETESDCKSVSMEEELISDMVKPNAEGTTRKAQTMQRGGGKERKGWGAS